MKSSYILSSSAKAAVMFLVTFVGFAGLGLGGTEFLMRECLLESDSNDGIYARRYMDVLRARNPDVILGDSQFRYGFSDGTNFTNLAYQGESPALLKLLAEKYFRRTDPRKVVLVAGPALFAVNREARGTEGYENFFFQENLIQHQLGFYVLSFEPGLVGLIGSWIQDPSRFPQCAGKTDEPDRDSLKSWETIPESTRRSLMRDRLDRQRPTATFENSRQFSDYHDLIIFLKSRGATICMARPPLTKDYEALMKEDTLSQKAMAALEYLAKTQNVKFVDYTSLPHEFTDDMFVNQDHLNEDGANLYSSAIITACFGDDYVFETWLPTEPLGYFRETS